MDTYSTGMHSGGVNTCALGVLEMGTFDKEEKQVGRVTFTHAHKAAKV